MKPIRLFIATFTLIVLASPTMAATAYKNKKLSGFVVGSGVLSFGNHCEVTVSLNPALPPAGVNILEVQLQGVEVPVLTFVPWDFLIESPNYAMATPRYIGVTASDGTKEWWKGYANEFNGAFDSGDWTIYIDEHPMGCGFYDNTTRLHFIYSVP